jgi:5,10-methylenetetrahydromethanopterin reductase
VAGPEDLTRVTERARQVEWLGFHRIAFSDSQNRSSDTIVALPLAACATERRMLSTAVTNPYTRHPAVLASAFASLQNVTGGRVVVGSDAATAHWPILELRLFH